MAGAEGRQGDKSDRGVQRRRRNRRRKDSSQNMQTMDTDKEIKLSGRMIICKKVVLDYNIQNSVQDLQFAIFCKISQKSTQYALVLLALFDYLVLLVSLALLASIV